MKHTPGPWGAERTPASEYFDWAVMASSGKGRTMYVGILTDNTEADARLIAAAPDLLEALKCGLASIEHCYHTNPDPTGDLWAAVEAARAAIAKAEGKQ